MNTGTARGEIWPELSYPAWRGTCATLHRWLQIAGKVRLQLTPWVNHSWHVTQYLSARGLTTGPMAHRRHCFEIEFDFIQHCLLQPVGAFWHQTMREFMLPDEVVRTAAAPDETLLAFLQSTYEAAADLAQWDREALERIVDPSKTAA